MAQIAIGMIETKGLAVLVQAADASLKAADVAYIGLEEGRQRPLLPVPDGRRGCGHRRRPGRGGRGEGGRRGRQRTRDSTPAR